MAFEPHRETRTLQLLAPGRNHVCRIQDGFESGRSISHSKTCVQKHSQISRWLLLLSGSILLPLVFATTSWGQTSQSSGKAATNSTKQSSVAGSKPLHKPAHRRKAHARVKKSTKPADPPSPPRPVPPAEQQAQPAKVIFAQGRLSIDANNASLMQILNQVSQQTGMAVQGLDHDERIYGQYGPDAVTDTLAALLDGTGYNYVIIGGGANHAPATLQLTPGNGAGSSPAAPATSDSVPAPPVASAGGASMSGPQTAGPSSGADPARVKTPQEIFDELRKAHPQ